MGFLWVLEGQFGKGGLGQKVHEGQKFVVYCGVSGVRQGSET